MQNVNRNRVERQEHARIHHSGPTEEGRDPSGATTADTQSIDLNHATLQQLLDIDGLEESTAAALHRHRTLHGHFRTWNELLQVEGVDEAQLHAIQRAARIGGVETA